MKDLKLEAPARRRIAASVMTGGPVDLSHVPEEFRADILKKVQEAQKGAGDLPGAPPGIREEERKAREAAIRAAEARQ